MYEINESINVGKSYQLSLLEVVTQANFGANEKKFYI